MSNAPHPSAITAFFADYPVRKLTARQLVGSAREFESSIFYLDSGRVRMYAISGKTGNTLTLHTFHAGAYFPLANCLAHQPTRYLFETMEPSLIRRAPAEAFEAFLLQHPKTLLRLVKRLSVGLDRIARRVEVMTFNDVYGRTITELLRLARHASQPKSRRDHVVLDPVTHQELSEMVGASREATSIAIKQLERRGFIEYHHHQITIPSERALRTERSDRAEQPRFHDQADQPAFPTPSAA